MNPQSSTVNFTSHVDISFVTDRRLSSCHPSKRASIAFHVCSGVRTSRTRIGTKVLRCLAIKGSKASCAGEPAAGSGDGWMRMVSNCSRAMSTSAWNWVQSVNTSNCIIWRSVYSRSGQCSLFCCMNLKPCARESWLEGRFAKRWVLEGITVSAVVLLWKEWLYLSWISKAKCLLLLASSRCDWRGLLRVRKHHICHPASLHPREFNHNEYVPLITLKKQNPTSWTWPFDISLHAKSQHFSNPNTADLRTTVTSSWGRDGSSVVIGPDEMKSGSKPLMWCT